MPLALLLFYTYNSIVSVAHVLVLNVLLLTFLGTRWALPVCKFSYFLISEKYLSLIFHGSICYAFCISSVQSHNLVRLFATPWTANTRLPCPSPTPRACSSSCPLSQWCHPAISSSVLPFSSCLQSFPASVSFPISQFFTPGGQNIGFSFTISASNEYSGLISFKIDWFDLLVVQGTLKSPPTP